MPFEKQEQKWLLLPKVGEMIDYSTHGKITLIDKVVSSKGFNFRERVAVIKDGQPILDDDGQPLYKDKDLGYRYDVVFEDGKRLSISSWKVYYAMIEAKIEEGDVIKIDHAEKGKWLIEKI